MADEQNSIWGPFIPNPVIYAGSKFRIPREQPLFPCKSDNVIKKITSPLLYSNDDAQSSSNMVGGSDTDEANMLVEIDPAMILNQILSFLPLQDLLKCRLVGSFWNEVICAGVANYPLLLWTEAFLKIQKPEQRNLNKFTVHSRQEVTEWNLWNAVKSSTLVSKFKCPNIRTQGLDLRLGAPKAFFQAHGHNIQCLEITKCELSLISFLEIVAACPNLVHLKIKPVPYHSIIYCESLSLQERERQLWTSTSLKSLNTLALYSEYKRHIFAGDTTESFTELRNYKRKHNLVDFLNTFTLDYVEHQLQPNVIDELIYAAPLLSEIHLCGWTGDTVACFLKSLLRHPRTITKLEFHDILLWFDHPEEFESSLAALLPKLHLKSFALNFLHQLPINTETSRLNSIVSRVVLANAPTLVELNLKNIGSMDESIFEPQEPGQRMWFNKLKILKIAGTNMRRVSNHILFMPRLKDISFKARKHEEDGDIHPVATLVKEQEYDYSLLELPPDLVVSTLSNHEFARGWKEFVRVCIMEKLYTIGTLIRSALPENLPSFGDTLGLMAEGMLTALALYCCFSPFFLSGLDNPFFFWCIIGIMTASFLVCYLEKKFAE